MTRDAPEAGNSAAASPIVDNRERKVGDFLKRELLRPGGMLSVVSAYFTIYGYGALRERLDEIGRMRFFYGDPRGVGDLDGSRPPT